MSPLSNNDNRISLILAETILSHFSQHFTFDKNDLYLYIYLLIVSWHVCKVANLLRTLTTLNKLKVIVLY